MVLNDLKMNVHYKPSILIENTGLVYNLVRCDHHEAKPSM
ncbi:MAG: hypothetical protein K0S47_4628 [Herbinix sp.]|jgi:hypothetical protein|nr:hypothetical protein [Herbinix sp.]MDF2789583.1 hypothetical protein [Neobacillus sp.]